LGKNNDKQCLSFTAIVMQEKSQTNIETVTEISAGRVFRFLLECKSECTLLSVVVYVIAFFLLYPLIGPNVGALSVLPVMMVGWGYGTRIAFVAGLLSLAINTVFLNLVGQGPGGWDVLIREAGAVGPIAVVLIGVAMGKLSDLTRQLRQEIRNHEQTVEKLARSRESLELRVAERTEELSKQQEILYQGQSLAKFGTVQRDLQTGENWWSDEAYSILGIAPQEPAPTFEGFLEHVHPNDREYLKEINSKLRKTGNEDAEYRMIRSSGEELTVYSQGRTHYDEEGNPLRMIITLLDITQRKQAEKAVRKSQESLAEAQRIAHLGSWEWNIPANTTVASDEYYRIFGLTQGTEVTYESFLNCLHLDDREAVKATLDGALSEKKPHQIDFRIVLTSGEVRFIHCEAEAYFDDAGNPIRQVGTVHDITERKQAEMEIQKAQKQLRALSRQLITAQETSRRSLALELHDDLGQDLALLSIEIGQLMQKASQSQAKGLQKLAAKTSEISSQVHNLSQQLHPSSLEHLGLVAASRSLCSEVARSSGIQIDFSHTNVPSPISPDVSICLFRILQESLTNIVKHSQVEEARVEVAGSPDKLQLTVRDSGVGFDPESVGSDGRLGFVSMRERLSLVSGELLIESQPRSGTQITASVPLSSSPSPVEHPTEVQEA
jgi:PAS domain S-box-containing protein